MSPPGIEPGLLALQTSMHPLYYGTLLWVLQKLFDSDCKRVGQKEPPFPPGPQALKIYVGSNRARLGLQLHLCKKSLRRNRAITSFPSSCFWLGLAKIRTKRKPKGADSCRLKVNSKGKWHQQKCFPHPLSQSFYTFLGQIWMINVHRDFPCIFLQYFADFCKVLQILVKFYRFLQVLPDFC